MHVDKFVDDFGKGNNYARFFFFLHRLPAVFQLDFDEYIRKYKLFCTWNGNRWRVTGASRLGDIWLTSNYEQETGYEHRVDLELCSEWSNKV